MENEKQIPPEDNGWLDQWLADHESQQEIGPDEDALIGSGLSDLADMELEKILQEAVSENWGAEESAESVELAEAPEEPAAATPETPETASPPEISNTPATPGEEAPVRDLDDVLILNEPPKEPTPVPENKDPVPERKVRPRRKKGYGLFGLPHLLSTAIWAGIVLFVGISLGRLIWVCAADILAFGREDRTVTITITEADNLDSIADKLYQTGLIKYPRLFKLYGQLTNLEEDGDISVGTFELNTLYDYHALVAGMRDTSSYRKTVEVVIPEGYNCAQIFALLEEEGVCSVETLETYAQTSQFDSYWFLEDIDRGNKYCLEGFLFPNTYEFYTNDTPQRIFHKMLSSFESTFDEDMVAKIDELNARLVQMYLNNGYSQDYAEARKLTLRQVVTVASMIEKETAHSGESQDIAAVIYNRLTNPGEYPFLNIDATIVYALGGKQDLTSEDLQIDHPYNTYRNEGLPPGPIANPGSLSLKSALAPSEEGYYYYALNPETGDHHFSKTYQEHQDFLASLG